MDRILGIDYGARRIGVAVADSQTRIATPLTTIGAQGEATRDARSVADYGQTEGANCFVVGLPLNMDGTDSQQTTRTRRFAAELARLSTKSVYLHDERLSSFAADEVLDEAEIAPSRRKGLIDRIAAQKILQSYLDGAA